MTPTLIVTVLQLELIDDAEIDYLMYDPFDFMSEESCQIESDAIEIYFEVYSDYLKSVEIIK